ncbi:MAG: tetratricopeptide repeat protein, partial [Polyangiaceae bacterium]|nr:tetratricopeptide repeat protein [Polyangiaceae bacterium]
SGDAKAAREAALAAADGAEASGADGTGAVAWLVALSSIAKGAVKPEDTELFERRARAAIARLGGPSDLLGDLEEILGGRRREDGKLEESLAHHKKELELRMEVYGEGSLAAADARAHIAGVLTFLDRVEEGAAEMELALQDAEAAIGSDHPRLAAFLNVHGLNLKNRGRYEESYAALARALEILERAVGKDSDRLSATITNLGNTCMHLQRLDEARALHGRAIAIKERTYGKEHPTVALALNNLANVEIQAKRFDEAIRLHERGLAIREKALAPDDRMIGMSLTNLGDALAGSKKLAEATERYRRSITIFEKLSGGKHSMLSYPLTGLGAALIELGKPEEAIEPLERALAIRDKDGLAKDLAAETRFALARALVASKKDRERGLRLADEARAEFVRGGEKKKVFLDELDAWRAVTK